MRVEIRLLVWKISSIALASDENFPENFDSKFSGKFSENFCGKFSKIGKFSKFHFEKIYSEII